jgi:hypothetical protein
VAQEIWRLASAPAVTGSIEVYFDQPTEAVCAAASFISAGNMYFATNGAAQKTVSIPLVVITGFFGMNVHLPMQDWPRAVYVVLGMLAASQNFRNGTFFIPELLTASQALKRGLQVLRPWMEKKAKQAVGRVVIGSVKFDLHDIGKNLVASLLEGGGFEVLDLGADVAPERFVEAVNATGANIVGLSALLTTTMPGMKSTIDARYENVFIHPTAEIGADVEITVTEKTDRDCVALRLITE